VLINGVTVTVKVAHVRLCQSRTLFVRAPASVKVLPESATRDLQCVFAPASYTDPRDRAF